MAGGRRRAGRCRGNTPRLTPRSGYRHDVARRSGVEGYRREGTPPTLMLEVWSGQRTESSWGLWLLKRHRPCCKLFNMIENPQGARKVPAKCTIVNPLNFQLIFNCNFPLFSSTSIHDVRVGATNTLTTTLSERPSLRASLSRKKFLRAGSQNSYLCRYGRHGSELIRPGCSAHPNLSSS